ncbi:alanine racemase [Nocardioides ganghwensis]|jgi:alanine racemase|uniref:Alanine racemase n=1 Tax=Nocardioides ganghwensis TaxID=252230 RepID=A0A4Q2SB53_9ACTN|nr:alanine racemase [Nocardioides ganghwensis]MBD3947743.1 alanine racemase [Nocardioides ganghwensis]RYB98285.1 alanine racemase [Nocardioides ganghwensis]
MSLTLTVDGERWRRHLLATVERHPGIVPVAKGNGYGLTLGRLARRAQWLADHASDTGAPVDTIAVGTYDEVEQAATRYDGDLLVLTPWRPFGAALDLDPRTAARVIHTVSRVEDLGDLRERHPQARFVLEQLTSMLRHGMTRRDLAAAADALGQGRSGLRGVAMHLPLNTTSHLGEVTRLINDVVASGLPTRTVFVSHLTGAELARLATSYPDFTVRPRIGTDLWLGDRGALSVTATVLDVHEVERGDTFGYRGRSAPKHGHIVVVSGGTAHGIGLEAPTGDQSLKARAATLARGGLDAVGFVRSPFSIDGKQRLFAEPPHMQASMLFVPSGARVPRIGEDIDVRVRFTATDFDRVVVG